MAANPNNNNSKLDAALDVVFNAWERNKNLAALISDTCAIYQHQGASSRDRIKTRLRVALGDDYEFAEERIDDIDCANSDRESGVDEEDESDHDEQQNAGGVQNIPTWNADQGQDEEGGQHGLDVNSVLKSNGLFADDNNHRQQWKEQIQAKFDAVLDKEKPAYIVNEYFNSKTARPGIVQYLDDLEEEEPAIVQNTKALIEKKEEAFQDALQAAYICDNFEGNENIPEPLRSRKQSRRIAYDYNEDQRRGFPNNPVFVEIKAVYDRVNLMAFPLTPWSRRSLRDRQTITLLLQNIAANWHLLAAIEAFPRNTKLFVRNDHMATEQGFFEDIDPVDMRNWPLDLLDRLEQLSRVSENSADAVNSIQTANDARRASNTPGSIWMTKEDVETAIRPRVVDTRDVRVRLGLVPIRPAEDKVGASEINASAVAQNQDPQPLAAGPSLQRTSSPFWDINSASSSSSGCDCEADAFQVDSEDGMLTRHKITSEAFRIGTKRNRSWGTTSCETDHWCPWRPGKRLRAWENGAHGSRSASVKTPAPPSMCSLSWLLLRKTSCVARPPSGISSLGPGAPLSPSQSDSTSYKISSAGRSSVSPLKVPSSVSSVGLNALFFPTHEETSPAPYLISTYNFNVPFLSNQNESPTDKGYTQMSRYTITDTLTTGDPLSVLSNVDVNHQSFEDIEEGFRKRLDMAGKDMVVDWDKTSQRSDMAEKQLLDEAAAFEEKVRSDLNVGKARGSVVRRSPYVRNIVLGPGQAVRITAQ